MAHFPAGRVSQRLGQDISYSVILQEDPRNRVFLRWVPGAVLTRVRNVRAPSLRGKAVIGTAKKKTVKENNGKGLRLMRNCVTSPFISGLSSATCPSRLPYLGAHAFYPISWGIFNPTLGVRNSVRNNNDKPSVTDNANLTLSN